MGSNSRQNEDFVSLSGRTVAGISAVRTTDSNKPSLKRVQNEVKVAFYLKLISILTFALTALHL